MARATCRSSASSLSPVKAKRFIKLRGARAHSDGISSMGCLHRTLGNNVFLFGFFLFPPISARSGFSARSRRGGPAGGLAGRALFALRQNAAEGVWGSEGRFWGGMVPGLSFITVSYYCMIRIITIIIDYLGSGDPRGSGMQ